LGGSGDRERFQNEIGSQLERIEEAAKIYKYALGRIVRELEADAGPSSSAGRSRASS